MQKMLSNHFSTVTVTFSTCLCPFSYYKHIRLLTCFSFSFTSKTSCDTVPLIAFSRREKISFHIFVNILAVNPLGLLSSKPIESFCNDMRIFFNSICLFDDLFLQKLHCSVPFHAHVLFFILFF